MDDVVLDTDWAEQWRALVRERDIALGSRDESYWNERSKRFAVSLSGQSEPFDALLERWLAPQKTLIDVGAGVGRYAVSLAERLRHVTAVEPSAGMRAAIEPRANLTVIPQHWPGNQKLVADLVICVHSLYPIADIVPFIRALDAAARERVFVALRDTPSRHPAEILTGGLPEPLLRHAFLVLRQMGIAPDVWLYRYQSSYRFRTFESALEDARRRGGPSWDEERGIAFLHERLRRTADGLLEFDCGEMVAGVLHWAPSST